MLSLFDPIIRLFDADSEPSAAVARGHHWFDRLTVKLANAPNRREFLRVGATGVAGSALSSCIPPLACCNHHLLNVTVSPVAFGAGITVSGNQYLGAAGDTYWIGVCGDNSRYCQTQNWLWSTTLVLGSGVSGPASLGYYFETAQCPTSYGTLWGYNVTASRTYKTPVFVQCGLDLPGGGACTNGSYCQNGCCYARGVCSAGEYPPFYPATLVGPFPRVPDPNCPYGYF